LSELTTNQKGAIAETAIVHAAARAGIVVLKPLYDVRYDLVFDFGHRFSRVQCKWVARTGDVVAIPCRTCRRGPEGFIHRSYTAQEIDALAAYCADVNRCFYLPMSQIVSRSTVQLRLAATRNGQRKGVNWADDFDFERLDWSALEGP
jgi:PD-(D/E)XK endonuclease